MKKVWILAMRDFKSYFLSPLGYILVGAFLAIMGFFFRLTLLTYAQQSIRQQQYNLGEMPTITDGIILPMFGNMNLVLLFFIPAITMGLLADEKKQNTIELLLTSPITLTQLVFGKFLSAMLFVLVLLGCTLVYPLTLITYGNPDLGPIFTNYLGTFMLTACYVSIGLVVTALTESQIVAFMITLVTSLLLWIVSYATQAAGPFWSEFFGHLSLIHHYYQSFGRGLISSKSVVLYLSFVGFGLYLTQRVLDSYRWR